MTWRGQTIAGRLAKPACNVAIVPQHAPGDNTRTPLPLYRD
jgi:hypothetical protein